MQTLGINAVTIIAFVILARLISTKEMGVWAILLLINATCQTFAALSIPQAVTKFVSENVSRGARSTAAAAFYQALRTILVVYAPVVASIYLGATFLASHLLGDVSYAPLFRILAFDVFFYAGMLPLVTGTLLGLQMFRETAVVGLAVGGFLRQLLIIALIILMKNFVGLVIGWLVSDAMMTVIYLGFAVRALGAPRFDFPLAKLLRFSLPLTFANVAAYAQNWFDRAMLIVFVPLATLGIYNASVTAFGVLVGISGAMSNMLFPAYSSIQDKTGAGSNMGEAIRLATRYSSFTLVPIAFALLALAKPALTLFVGESYIGGYVPLIILSGTFALTASVMSLGPVLLALEETKVTASITAVSVAISIVLAYMLLPIWGIVGASIARALAMTLGATLTVLMLSRKIAIQLDLRAIAKNLFAGASMALVVAAVQLVTYSKFMLPLYMLIGTVVYLIMLRLLKAVDAADLKILRGFLGKRLSRISNLLGWIVAA